MAHWNDCYFVVDDAIVVDVHVLPQAGRPAVIGRHGHALKLRVAAPPIDGRENAAACELLAELSGIEAVAVKQVSGETSRQKRFRLVGADPDVFERAIDTAVERAGGGVSRKR